MLLVAPRSSVTIHSHTQEMAMVGKQLTMKFSPEMDEASALIQAYLTVQKKDKTGRSHAVAYAVERFLESLPVDRNLLESLKQRYILDTSMAGPGTREARGVWISPDVDANIESIGRHLEGIGGFYVPKLRASKAGYNRALIIYFAMRQLADEIRKSHPDLQPVPIEIEPVSDKSGRKSEGKGALLDKYPEVVDLLRQGMEPKDVANRVDASLNTIKKVKSLLDEE
jgi:hypothetical protein